MERKNKIIPKIRILEILTLVRAVSQPGGQEHVLYLKSTPPPPNAAVAQRKKLAQGISLLQHQSSDMTQSFCSRKDPVWWVSRRQRSLAGTAQPLPMNCQWQVNSPNSMPRRAQPLPPVTAHRRSEQGYHLTQASSKHRVSQPWTTAHQSRRLLPERSEPLGLWGPSAQAGLHPTFIEN